jgi:membrane fusion protein (multidrug efflux system)
VVLIAAAIAVSITRNWDAWQGDRAEQETHDAFVAGDLTPLSTKVEGLVRDVKVNDYQHVRKGEELVQLDDKDFRAQVAEAAAAVEAARAALETNRRQRELQDAAIARALAVRDQARAQVVAAQAATSAVYADVVRTREERNRQQALFVANAATEQRLQAAVADEQRFAAEAANRDAALTSARAALESSEVEVDVQRRGKSVLVAEGVQLRADLQARESALAAAEVTLSYARIVAPAGGTVGERRVRPGQLVAPGTQVLSLVGDRKWIQANFRETQLTNIAIGSPATIRIDMYPGEVLRGKVIAMAPATGSQFALLPPDNATGNFTKVVQRVSVKIELDASPMVAKLRPGLSAVVTVHTTQPASKR